MVYVSLELKSFITLLPSRSVKTLERRQGEHVVLGNARNMLLRILNLLIKMASEVDVHLKTVERIAGLSGVVKVNPSSTTTPNA